MFIKFLSVILFIIGNKIYFVSNFNLLGRYLKVRKVFLFFEDRRIEFFFINENIEFFFKIFIVLNWLYVKLINLFFSLL